MLNDRRPIVYCYLFSIGLLLLAISSPDLLSKSKQTKKEASPQKRSTFKVPVNVVVLNATVTDKAGNPVTDLKADDFKLYDNQLPQKIQTFAMESFGPPETEAEEAPPVTAPIRATAKKKDRLPRMISIVIDDLTMDSVLDFSRIVDAVKEFIKKDIGPMDQVAIVSGSRKVQVSFSSNKQYLLEELSTVLGKLNIDTNYRTLPDMTDLEAWQITDGRHEGKSPYMGGLGRECLLPGGHSGSKGGVPGNYYNSELSISDANRKFRENIHWDPEACVEMTAARINAISKYRTNDLLYTIQQNIRILGHFEGTRTVVLFSDGLIARKATPAAHQLQELVNMALRSGIVLNTVSTRGVVTFLETLFDKNEEWKLNIWNDDEREQSIPLAQMAEDTGGIFSVGNNFYKPLRTISRRRVSYYIMTYGMPENKSGDNYHHIRLEVMRPGLKISYRKGYYTPGEEMTYENTKQEDLMASLNALGNMTEIPMTLSYNYSQEEDASYSVSFVTNVNIHNLKFSEESGRRINQVSLVLVAFDETDRYVSGLEKAIDFQLLESSYADLRKRGLTSRVELKLPYGRYKIKAVVREGNQGKMGSITKSVSIP